MRALGKVAFGERISPYITAKQSPHSTPGPGMEKAKPRRNKVVEYRHFQHQHDMADCNSEHAKFLKVIQQVFSGTML